MEKVWECPDSGPEDDMARRNAKAVIPPQKPVDIADYVSALKAAGRDRPRFEATVARIEADTQLRLPDLVAIAVQYRGGGAKPPSKRAALEAIGKRFLELVRDHAQSVQAAKARPW